jgi:quercetin dioxygenase-like cupin family protein
MTQYHVDFSCLEWESPMEGVRQKVLMDSGKRLRMVEYSPKMPQHWCEKGHFGYILEGRFEIEFERGTHIFNEGDGVFIPDGAAQRHRAKVLSDVVRVIFVEDIHSP